MVRTRNLFDPRSSEPFKLSRSKLQMFLDCPRCFYLDRRLGIGRPDSPPFTLNNAVDLLLKREFDAYRAQGKPHPLMTQYGVDAVPMRHPLLEQWRDTFTGIQYLHPQTNLLLFGAVDDLWMNDGGGEAIIVDYKATSTEKPISLDDEWKDTYKRQMEVYQWLLRKNSLTVSDTGYFVYVNAKRDRTSLDARLDCSLQILTYTGNDSWVEDAVLEAHRCLCDDSPPPGSSGCDWCTYRHEAQAAEIR